MLATGLPARTSASALAITCRPIVSGTNAPSVQAGSRLVNQVVVVTWEISASNWMAEMPPPTTITCCPANSRADTYCEECNCRPRKGSCPGYQGRFGADQIPVALMTARVSQEPQSERTTRC